MKQGYIYLNILFQHNKHYVSSYVTQKEKWHLYIIRVNLNYS